MRYLITLYLFLILGYTLSAQYNEGNIYINQQSHLQYFSNAEDLPLGTDLNLRGGYFIRDRLLVGTEFRVSDFSFPSPFLAPFVRYYLPNRSGRALNFFGEAGLGVNFDNNLALSPTAALGAEYWLAPGVVLTGSARQVIGTGSEPNETIINIGLNVLLGEEHQTDPSTGYLHEAGSLLFNPGIVNITFGKVGIGRRNFSSQGYRLDGGFFLTESIALMAVAAYGNTDVNIGTSFNERIIGRTDLEFGLGIRYQFNNGSRWQPYVQAGVRHTVTNQRGNTFFIVGGNPVTEIDENFTAFDFGPGVVYHLSRSVVLDAGLRWRPLIAEDSFLTYGDQVAGELRVIIFPGRTGEKK